MENNILEYSISEVSQLTGIKDFTLRIWEKRYKLALSARRKNNQRVYRESDVQLLMRFAALTSRGYKISELVAMSPEEISLKIGTVFVPKTSNQIIKRLMKLAENFNSKEFDIELQHDILDAGLEHAIISIIVPMMEMMEAKCIQDSNYLAIKQFAYNVLHRRLIVASDVQENENGEKIVIFSPLEDHGELSLLIVDYILKKYGKSPIYCGDKMKVSQIRSAMLSSDCKKVVMVGRLFETTEDISDHARQLQEISGIEAVVLDHNLFDAGGEGLSDLKKIKDIQGFTEYLKG